MKEKNYKKIAVLASNYSSFRQFINEKCKPFRVKSDKIVIIDDQKYYYINHSDDLRGIYFNDVIRLIGYRSNYNYNGCFLEILESRIIL